MPTPNDGVIISSELISRQINISSGWYVHSSATATTSNIINVHLNGELLHPTNTLISSVAYTTGTIYTGSLITTSTTNEYTAYIGSNTVWINGTMYASTPPAVDWSQIREYVRPPVKKSTKNSIKRALKLMMNMGFEEDVKVFLKGDSIEVAHPNSLFKFVITKYAGSLIERTVHPGYSTPYRLQLYTKSDIHIANLCVYMEETPILDQVLGVAMFIKSGSEEMILSQANWFNLNTDMELREILALEYPYLQKKLRLNERRIESLQ